MSDRVIKGKKSTVNQFMSRHAWHKHVKEFRSTHPETQGMQQRDILKLAKTTYKPKRCPHCKRDFDQ